MNAYREHLKEELEFTTLDSKAIIEAVVAVMCDQKARTIPAISRAINLMNGHELTRDQITNALSEVKKYGWHMVRTFGGGEAEYRLWKA